MGERRPGPWDLVAGLGEHRPKGLPGEPAEHDDRPHGWRDHAEFGGEPGSAMVSLLRRRLILRWRTADRGNDAGADEPLPVARGHARRLARQPAAVQRGEQEVAAPVASEDPAGPVTAVCGRSEAEDDDGRLRIAPARDRASPVRLVPEGLAPDGGD